MFHVMEIGEIIKGFRSDLNYGLSKGQVLKAREVYGENKLKEAKKESVFLKFIKQFNDFMIIVLIFASIVSAVISYFDGSNDYLDSIIIIFIVVLNAIMGVVQEERAEKSLEALKKMASPTAKVKRDGEIKAIPSEELVPGDYIIIETGSYIPADARLIKTSNLKVEESSLTGETVPVLKNERAILQENIQVSDMINMVFASTIVVSGNAEAIVTSTGMNTKVGKIASLIIENKSPETPLQRKLRRSWKEIRPCCTWHLFFNIYNRVNKEDTCKYNVYDISWTCCCSNSRRITCSCYNNAFNSSNKDGKEK